MYDIYEEPEMLHEAMAIMEEGYNGLLDQYLGAGSSDSKWKSGIQRIRRTDLYS